MRHWWLKLSRYGLAEWRSLSFVVLLMVLTVGTGLLAPWPLKLLVDNVLREQPLPATLEWLVMLPGGRSPYGLLSWLAAATVVLYLLKQSLTMLQRYVESGVGARMIYALAHDLFDRLQWRSLQYHQQQRAGDLIRRVTSDSACVRDLVIGVYLPMITSLVTVVGMFVVMWQLDKRLAVLAAFLVIPLMVIVRWFAASMTERKYREWELQGDISAFAEQTLSAMPVVQAFASESTTDARFRHIAGENVRASLRSEVTQLQFSVSTGMVTTIGTAVVMVAGGLSVLEGELTVGSLLVLTSYFAALYSPIESLAYLSEAYASAAAGARRVLELFDDGEEDGGDRPGAWELVVAPGEGVRVEFRDVVFGYRPGIPIVDHVSLRLEAGQSLALVGPSGVGKSTLVSLIARLYTPWEGKVLVHGRDVREWTVESLRRHIAYVPQEPFLLPLTIAENIAYGRPQATRAEIVAAAVSAQADAFIRRLPDGYQTLLGDRGVTLSGGERQRLSLARAFLKDSPLLILDEPTSSLDGSTEVALFEAWRRLAAGRTTILITHRLPGRRLVDRTLRLERSAARQDDERVVAP